MKLLSPIKIGPIEVKNRVVSTAHAAFTDFFDPNCDGERYMAYQERRAQGGAGLIIFTAMHVHPSSQIPQHYVFDAKTMAPKFQQITTRLHRHGAKCISQLFHYGAQGKSDLRDDFHPIWSFSGTTTRDGEVTHKMTDDEIEEVIDGFAFAAKVAVENGMDGVELHGTHGYLIQQSFSPYANFRDDKWGKELYFVRTLSNKVREAIGPDKVMGFRISVDDFVDPKEGGVGPERLRQIASEVVGTGLFDYLNHSEGSGGIHYARAIGSFRHKFGEYLPLTRALREATGGQIPVIGVTKIPTPDLAEQALQDGICDMVGMTRAQIADPDLVNKVANGKAHRVRTCTGANQGCFDRASTGKITCFQNPEVGEENRFKALDVPISQKKKVLVIGGGPAGMESAEVLMAAAAAMKSHPDRFLKSWIAAIDAAEMTHGRSTPAWYTEAARLLGNAAATSPSSDHAIVLWLLERASTSMNEKTLLTSISALDAMFQQPRTKALVIERPPNENFWLRIRAMAAPVTPTIEETSPGENVVNASSTALRQAAIGLLSHSDMAEDDQRFADWAKRERHPQTFAALLRAWSQSSTGECDQFLLKLLDSGTPQQRSLAVELIGKADRRIQLVAAELADHPDLARSLGPMHLRQLLERSRSPIRNRFADALESLVDDDRKKILNEFKDCLQLRGNVQRGKALFEKHCASCHRVGDVGVDVGPDISDSRTQSREQLLLSILDPNRAIDNNFFRFVVLTNDDQIVEGIIAEETQDAIIIRGQQNKQQVIARSEIVELRPTGQSLMPEGLETQFDQQGMADLLAYIKGWRYSEADIPISDAATFP